VPAILLALAAQPALAQLAGVDACPLGGGSAQAAAAAVATDPGDPLLRVEALLLGPDGTLVAEAAEAERVAAPTAVPLAADSTVLWARDQAFAGTLRGDLALSLLLRVCLPSPAATAAALSVQLLVNSLPVAETDAGPSMLMPGNVALAVSLATDGVALAAGDNVALAITLHGLNAEPAPSVWYLAGMNGSRLDYAIRYASLDALGHAHANGDRHVLFADWQPRLGDIGAGLWGVDLSIGKEPGASPAPLRVPANASRVLLQMHLDRAQDDDPAAPRNLTLQVPGGPTTVYRGEVVSREIARAGGGEIRCTDCGPGGQPATVATIQDLQPPPPQPGDPLEQGSTPPATGGAGMGPGGSLVDAALEEGEYGWWILALAVPAGIMLLASIGYVMRRGGSWGEHPARATRRVATPAGRR
jgi:hypothetical protein